MKNIQMLNNCNILSKEEVTKSANEINQECGKNYSATPMYKSNSSEDNLKIVSWINAGKSDCCLFYNKRHNISQNTSPTQTSVSVNTPQSA